MGKLFSKDPPHSHPSPELKKPWRTVMWSEKDEIMRELEAFRPHSNVLRILLYGPTGAGKSCFINSVQRILLGRNFIGALEQWTQSGASFTVTMKSHKLKKPGGGHYPFVFSDLMGLEAENVGGIQTDDIIAILKGHILDGCTFNASKCIAEDDRKYKANPKLCDKVHCLVSIVPADSISMMKDEVINKMRRIRVKASELNIPQVIVLTKVDLTCEIVNEDLKKLYYSKKILQKVHECSNRLGNSLNCIYPVKNYCSEIDQDEDNDFLIAMALRDIVNFANDFVEDQEDTNDE